MRRTIRLARALSVVSLLTLAAAGWTRGLPQAQAQTPPPDAQAEGSVVVLRRTGLQGLQGIDGATGDMRWEVGQRGDVFAAIAGANGIVFVSAAADDGSGTDVYAIPPPPSASPEMIEHVPGFARLAALAPTGDHLYALHYATADAADSLPTDVTTLPIPAPWQGSPMPAGVYRDLGGGILTTDGTQWYGLRAIKTPQGAVERVELRALVFHEEGAPTLTVLTIPTHVNYFSLHLAPDGRTLYAVDHLSAQTIHVVDATQNTLVQSVALREQGSKAPACAASLSPQGDRLYVAGRDGNVGDGIDVMDTASLQRVAHFLPGRDFYCLAISPDGGRLFASAEGSLVTIDARTGNEQRAVALSPAKDVRPYLFLAATAG